MIAKTHALLVDVFAGAGGDVVLCQEWPDLTRGDTFVRVFIDPKDAELVCQKIMAAAKEARK